MKLVEAIIKPVKVKEVQDALLGMGVDDVMESAVISHGRRKGESMFYRGAEFMIDFVEKVKLEMIVSDEAVGKIVDVIGTIARTERRDDCRIFILPFVEAF